MRIIKTTNRRGTFWAVNGLASCASVESAVDLAFEAQAEAIAAAPVHTLWTVYA